MTRSEVRLKQGSTHVENMNAARMTLLGRPLPMKVIREKRIGLLLRMNTRVATSILQASGTLGVA